MKYNVGNKAFKHGMIFGIPRKGAKSDYLVCGYDGEQNF